MNGLTIFESAEFGQIRTVQLNNEIYFVGKDVAAALGYSNTKDALTSHVNEEDKRILQRSEIATLENHIPKEVFPVNFVCGDIPNRGLTIINESGLYALIFGSKLESAKRFKHWVTSEVLPSLRRNGGYLVNQENMTPEQIMAAGLKAAEAIIAQRNREIERMKPKEIFADAVSASHTSILIGDLAKILKQNGMDTGQKRLFERLRRDGYLVKSGVSRNMPTQRAMEMGLFEIKETAITNPDGSQRITRTTKVTGRGQQYLINRYLNQHGRAG